MVTNWGIPFIVIDDNFLRISKDDTPKKIIIVPKVGRYKDISISIVFCPTDWIEHIPQVARYINCSSKRYESRGSPCRQVIQANQVSLGNFLVKG